MIAANGNKENTIMSKFDFMYVGKYFDFSASSDYESWLFGFSIRVYPFYLGLFLGPVDLSIHWADELAPGRI